MIVDTSALIAIVQDEPEAPAFVERIAAADHVRVSSGTLLEAGIVVDRIRNPALSRRLNQLVASIDPVIEPFTAEHAEIARDAYREFGRGSSHPARLNFGDCFAYVLAYATEDPLLFKGDDFTHTDIKPAVSPGA